MYDLPFLISNVGGALGVRITGPWFGRMQMLRYSDLTLITYEGTHIT